MVKIENTNYRSLRAVVRERWYWKTQNFKGPFNDVAKLDALIKACQSQQEPTVSSVIDKTFRVQNKVIDSGGHVPLQLCFVEPRSGRQGDLTLVFLHGGGYVLQIQDYHWRWIAYMVTKLKCRAMVVLYPMPPKSTYKNTYPVVV